MLTVVPAHTAHPSTGGSTGATLRGKLSRRTTHPQAPSPFANPVRSARLAWSLTRIALGAMSGATPTSIRNAEFDRPVHGDDAHLLAAYLEHRLGAITAAQRVRALACACPAGHA